MSSVASCWRPSSLKATAPGGAEVGGAPAGDVERFVDVDAAQHGGVGGGGVGAQVGDLGGGDGGGGGVDEDAGDGELVARLGLGEGWVDGGRGGRAGHDGGRDEARVGGAGVGVHVEDDEVVAGVRGVSGGDGESAGEGVAVGAELGQADEGAAGAEGDGHGGGVGGDDGEAKVDALDDAAGADVAEVLGEHGGADGAVAFGEFLEGEGFFGHGLLSLLARSRVRPLFVSGALAGATASCFWRARGCDRYSFQVGGWSWGVAWSCVRRS